MKNYRDSEYAVNKYARGIVYRFADQTVEVTLEDYLRENPSKTEADFAEMKALSDEMYLEQVRNENRKTYKDISLYGLDETDVCAVPSPEDICIAEQEQTEKRQQRLKLAKAILEKLTDVQKRRYILHTVKGLTVREIADMEGVSHPSVVESLLTTERKMSKFFASS